MLYTYIIILLLLYIIFYGINQFIHSNENYTGFKTPYFFDNLNKYNYSYDNEKNIKKCKNGDKDCQIKNYAYHFNKLDAVKLVKNKVKTSNLLQKFNIPVPIYNVVDINDPINYIVQSNQKARINFPIIIKPIDGTFGIDVYTNLENEKELNNAILRLKERKKYKNMMIEEFIEGSVYRVFVFNNKIIDIIKREKPYIVGNGYDSVEILINKRNKALIGEGFFETKNIGYDYIEKQGFTMRSIVPAHNKVYITNVINMHNGAILERINISSIPHKNMELFINVGKVLDINCYGLDYISKDITIPYMEGKDVILEVNGTPDTEIHTKIDDYGNNFFEKIVKNIF